MLLAFLCPLWGSMPCCVFLHSRGSVTRKWFCAPPPPPPPPPPCSPCNVLCPSWGVLCHPSSAPCVVTMRPEGPYLRDSIGPSCMPLGHDSKQEREKVQSCEFCTTEVYCILFWPIFLPLQVAPGFACSVASLNQSPGHQLPGCHSLRCGTLADYLLG